jgi:glycerate dehydrogenase
VNPIIGVLDGYVLNQGDLSWDGLFELDEVYSWSDFVSLNCALTDKNRELINEESLGKMKKSCFLVNASRGGLMAYDDIAAALNNRMIAGAGIDVLGTEPLGPDNPLYGDLNVEVTHHIAWVTMEAHKSLMDTSGKTSGHL